MNGLGALVLLELILGFILAAALLPESVALSNLFAMFRCPRGRFSVARRPR